jgi:hypothetical protein
VGSVIVGAALTALSAILLPEDFWLGVLALCGIGAIWTIWHYIFVDCRQPLKPPVQKMIHEQVPYKPPFWTAYYAEEQHREELLRIAKREAKRNIPLDD